VVDGALALVERAVRPAHLNLRERASTQS